MLHSAGLHGNWLSLNEVGVGGFSVGLSYCTPAVSVTGERPGCGGEDCRMLDVSSRAGRMCVCVCVSSVWGQGF